MTLTEQQVREIQALAEAEIAAAPSWQLWDNPCSSPPTVAALCAIALRHFEQEGEIAQIMADWSRADHLQLHAGEMTAQELRTVKAVVGGIASALKSKASP